MAGGGGIDTFIIGVGDLAATNATDLIVDFQGAGATGGDVILFTGFAAGTKLDYFGVSGNAHVYELHAIGGAALGRLQVASGGVKLLDGDYIFA